MKVLQQGARRGALVALLLFSSVLVKEVYGSDVCNTHDSASWTPAASIGTLKAAVIYACNQNASTIQLPSWAKSIWDSSKQLSVPRFYKDNSLGKYLMLSTPLGRDGDRKGVDLC